MCKSTSVLVIWGMSLKENLKRARLAADLSQTKLAEIAGVSQQLISQIERGVNFETKKLPSIARAVGKTVADLDPAYAAQEVADVAIFPNAAVPLPRGPKNLPVYASAQGGPGEIIVTYDPIDYVERPEPLASVRDAYAMYIVGDSMSPAFEAGDQVFVNPHLPVRGGDDVLVFRERDGGTDVAATVKRLVRPKAEEWQLEQFNPPKRFSLRRSEWPRAHVIIGKFSRR